MLYDLFQGFKDTFIEPIGTHGDNGKIRQGVTTAFRNSWGGVVHGRDILSLLNGSYGVFSVQNCHSNIHPIPTAQRSRAYWTVRLTDEATWPGSTGVGAAAAMSALKRVDIIGMGGIPPLLLSLIETSRALL